VLPWLANKAYPHKYWHLVNMPVLTFALSPGSNNSFLLPTLLVGFIFQYLHLRYRREWFDKYNYVLSIALDSGMAIATLLITFLLMWKDQISPSGWLSPAGQAPDYYCHEANFTDPEL
jgi:hypothetical protein